MRCSHETDLTDESWAFIEPLIPPEGLATCNRTVNTGEVANAMLYPARTGSQWPRRWVVGRTLAWFGTYRPVSKDYEFALKSSEAMIVMGMINTTIRQLAPG